MRYSMNLEVVKNLLELKISAGLPVSKWVIGSWASAGYRIIRVKSNVSLTFC